jgi:hypothetical protein
MITYTNDFDERMNGHQRPTPVTINGGARDVMRLEPQVCFF